jgi:hypothetical protein
MKRSLLILAVFILVLGGVMLMSNLQSSPPPPIVAGGFLGFTNSRGRVEALFAFSNPPNAALFLHSVSLKDTSGASGSTNKSRGSFSWGRREQWGLAYAITVTTTNEPLRVVFQLQQPAVGPRRMIERIKEFLEILKGKELTLFTGRTFFVTNETSVVIAPR